MSSPPPIVAWLAQPLEKISLDVVKPMPMVRVSVSNPNPANMKTLVSNIAIKKVVNQLQLVVERTKSLLLTVAWLEINLAQLLVNATPWMERLDVSKSPKVVPARIRDQELIVRAVVACLNVLKARLPIVLLLAWVTSNLVVNAFREKQTKTPFVNPFPKMVVVVPLLPLASLLQLPVVVMVTIKKN